MRSRVPPLPRRLEVAPAHTPLLIALKAGLVALLVIVCMSIGWFLVKGRRVPRAAQVAQAVTKKTAKKRARAEAEPPAPAKKAEAPPAVHTPAPPPVASAPASEEPVRPAPKPTEQPREQLTYERHILPIMQRACVSCHGDRRKRGGLDLRTFPALVRGGDNGTGVKPGKPDESSLYTSVASGQMPPGKKKLPDADKERIREWIRQGAKSGR
jgi:mono/diheme cytochrome c family protein